MSSPECIFCKIINKEIPTQLVCENETTIVIKDIAPKAPIHYLIIPKKHLKDIRSLGNDDRDSAADIMMMATTLAEQLGGVSFRLVSNNGAESGQCVFHLHVHFLSGKTMTDF